MSNNFTRSDGQFNYYGFLPPDISVVWINDFARISWRDLYNGQAQYEVWMSLDGVNYTLFATTAAGAVLYDALCKQNDLVYFKVAVLQAGIRSGFSQPVQIQTPLCFWTDQAPIVNITLDLLNIGGAGVVHVEWGDGLFNDYNGPNAAIVHVYANPGQYCVRLSGAVDLITDLTIDAQVVNYGSLAMWTLPAGLLNLALTACAFTGDLSGWVLPAGLVTLDLGDNLFTGDLTNWIMAGFPLGMTDIVLTVGNVFTGNFTGLTAFIYAPAGLDTVDIQGMVFGGGLINVGVPAGAAAINYNFSDCNLNTLPRGNFRWVAALDFSLNVVDQNEIDDFLGYLDNFFTLGIVPLTNFALDISGVGMATPTGGMLNPAIISLQAKYVAAGFVFTPTIN